ncbi:DUF2147 domain-containing protein [Cecembia calidifontis]|jgi:uncharacterized protein (DUF2147 family)|uniref:Uncharacterized protein DUF2147 n=1 Tax=Cecembia calidifontis TaxID=1187080 RepID=A0A4Q7P7A7_9BACT|nr:DUF2147 domain-containing protein [Cecembia calidifontis]RZS96016.1 uncharacterized protein DUF2147 [Cecembia calidifontis]
MKKLILILSLSFLGTYAWAQNADDIVGVWEPGHGKARVKIDNIDGKYYGRIVWLKEPNDPETGKPKTDVNNPDASMKNVPLRGYRILKDFEYKGKGEWADGTIYDPETGNTYSSVITWKDENTLDIRGYVGVKTFGRSDTWRRLKVK